MSRYFVFTILISRRSENLGIMFKESYFYELIHKYLDNLNISENR